MNQNDMQKMRAHVVCILFASLPEYMHKAAKKYTDRSKNKEDSDKKRADREQKFDELIQAYPKVALAVFFREMEERLISVCLATKEQMEQEYRRVRRGQQLTMLEDQVYNMKSDLQKNGLAHLDSRMTKIFQQSKSKGNMVGSGSKSEQDKHRRSNSTASKHKHNTSSRARSKGKTNRSNSRKNQAPVRSASARRRQAQMRTSSKTSRQDAKTSSTRGRSNSQRQVSGNRDSKSRQSKSSARSMTSHRSFSRHTSRSKNSQSQHGSRNSSRSNASRVTCT